MLSKTELWSVDPGKGRSIQATLRMNENTGFSELDFRWDDGKPVEFPIQLTDTDLQNVIDVALDHSLKHGIDIRLPQQELTSRA
jgi:hypothetical protein